MHFFKKGGRGVLMMKNTWNFSQHAQNSGSQSSYGSIETTWLQGLANDIKALHTQDMPGSSQVLCGTSPESNKSPVPLLPSEGHSDLPPCCPDGTATMGLTDSFSIPRRKECHAKRPRRFWTNGACWIPPPMLSSTLSLLSFNRSSTQLSITTQFPLKCWGLRLCGVHVM